MFSRRFFERGGIIDPLSDAGDAAALMAITEKFL